MEKRENVTISEVAKAAGVSSATVSYVLSGRTDVKVADATREKVLSICRELGYKKGAGRERSAKHTVTIDDIAREAGVSTATVSYIVNGRTDVKISEETRRKVLQICNLRQYTPSSVARQLAGKKNDLIGILAPLSGSPAQTVRTCALLRELQKALLHAGYGTLLLTPDDLASPRRETPEGILCIDLTEAEFYTLKENCFVPIVAVDMIAGDPLFFNAYLDHAAILAAAKHLTGEKRLTCVARPYRNEAYLHGLKAAAADDKLLLAESLPLLMEYAAEHPEESYLFFEPLFADVCAPFVKGKSAVLTENSDGCKGCANMTPLPVSCREMAERAVEMLQSAIRREEDVPHTFRLAPKM